MSEKITSSRLQRRAVLYVRQRHREHLPPLDVGRLVKGPVRAGSRPQLEFHEFVEGQPDTLHDHLLTRSHCGAAVGPSSTSFLREGRFVKPNQKKRQEALGQP
ncbi:MAG: hypothetical protein AB7Q17_14610 [Phycisphaerae bacterium]